jgi:hypothetical protein
MQPEQLRVLEGRSKQANTSDSFRDIPQRHLRNIPQRVRSFTHAYREATEYKGGPLVDNVRGPLPRRSNVRTISRGRYKTYALSSEK